MMTESHAVTFQWPHTEPNSVIVTGSFDEWQSSIPLIKGPSGFQATVLVPWAQRIPYKFIVDGQWSVKENRPTEYDSVGNLNNVYHSPPRPTPIQLKSAASSIMTETTIDAGEHQIVQVEEEDVIMESPGEKEDGKKIDDGNDQHNMPERDSETMLGLLAPQVPLNEFHNQQDIAPGDVEAVGIPEGTSVIAPVVPITLIRVNAPEYNTIPRGTLVVPVVPIEAVQVDAPEHDTVPREQVIISIEEAEAGTQETDEAPAVVVEELPREEEIQEEEIQEETSAIPVEPTSAVAPPPTAEEAADSTPAVEEATGPGPTPAVEEGTVPTPVAEETVEPTPVVEEAIESTPVIEEPIEPATKEAAEPTPVIEEIVESTPVEESIETATIVEEAIETTPVIEEVIEPTPVVEEVIEPTPVVEEAIKPTPVIEEPIEPATEEAAEPTLVIEEAIESTPVVEESIETTTIVEEAIEPTSVVENTAEPTSISVMPVPEETSPSVPEAVMELSPGPSSTAAPTSPPAEASLLEPVEEITITIEAETKPVETAEEPVAALVPAQPVAPVVPVVQNPAELGVISSTTTTLPARAQTISAKDSKKSTDARRTLSVSNKSNMHEKNVSSSSRTSSTESSVDEKNAVKTEKDKKKKRRSILSKIKGIFSSDKEKKATKA